MSDTFVVIGGDAAGMSAASKAKRIDTVATALQAGTSTPPSTRSSATR